MFMWQFDNLIVKCWYNVWVVSNVNFVCLPKITPEVDRFIHIWVSGKYSQFSYWKLPERVVTLYTHIKLFTILSQWRKHLNHQNSPVKRTRANPNPLSKNVWSESLWSVIAQRHSVVNYNVLWVNTADKARVVRSLLLTALTGYGGGSFYANRLFVATFCVCCVVFLNCTLLVV